MNAKNVRTWKLEKNGRSLSRHWKSLPSPVFSGLQEARLFAQPHQVSADPRRLGSERRAQPAESRQEQVSPRFVGRSDHHHRQRNSRASRRSTATMPILFQGDGHGESKTINTPHGQPGLLLDHMGGFTLQVRNPDSWEGWYWGSKHVWGQGIQGNVLRPPTTRSRTAPRTPRWCLFWGCDPGDHAVGVYRPVRQPADVLLERHRHQADLYLSRT